MKFITDFLNSGTEKQQSRKKLGALLICITAALLVIALIVMSVVAIAGAIKNKNQDEEGDDTGAKIPSGYVTTTFEDGQSSNGLLLLIDETHPYVGSADLVSFPAKGTEERSKTETGGVVYSMDTSKKAQAEAIVAFNKMTQAFYDAKKDDCLYIHEIDENGTTFTLTYYADYENDAKNRPTIYQVEKYQWIYDNAASYGFVRTSSLEGEENVFRYIGVVHAKAMQDKKLATFAEYITYLQTKTNLRSQLGVSIAGEDNKTVKYGVYYIGPDEEEKYVPEEGTFEYTVSGDNMGGYIVTVNKTRVTKTTETK